MKPKAQDRPTIWYGTRGRGYCEACAKKAKAHDGKPLSHKEPDRCCSRCSKRFVPLPEPTKGAVGIDRLRALL